MINMGWHHQFNGRVSLNRLWEMVKDREAWHAAVQGNTIEQLNNNKSRANTLLGVSGPALDSQS